MTAPTDEWNDPFDDVGEPPPSRTRPRDEARLRALVLEHHDFVWRLVRRFGVRDEAAEDATQEVFWVAARRLDDIKPGSARSFLFGVAIRVSAQVRRARARRREVAEPEGHERSIPSPESGPDVLLDRARARALLDEVLDTMEPDTHEVFVLFELEEMEIKDIAEVLDIPIGTVGSRLRRARKEFSTIAARLRARLHFPGGLK